MAYRLAAFVCFQVIVLQTVYGQCVNRFAPNCGCSNILPVADTILPNQVLVNQLPNQVFVNQVPNILPSQILYNQLPAVETVLPSPLATTTIIQDSTVANNLANTLQLLVVSNLLSNTLPCAGPVELLPRYAGPVELLPRYARPVEVMPNYAAPVEVVAPYTSVSPCGCGLGGFSLRY